MFTASFAYKSAFPSAFSAASQSQSATLARVIGGEPQHKNVSRPQVRSPLGQNQKHVEVCDEQAILLTKTMGQHALLCAIFPVAQEHRRSDIDAVWFECFDLLNDAALLELGHFWVILLI